MTDLIDTTEMYLRTIYELEEEGIVPLRARIAERLGHSGPTVSQTVARMERDGLVAVSGDRHLELSGHGRLLAVTGDRHLELTDDGREKATRVMRKHRLAERLLLDVIGLEWEYVHDEACRWEHVMSDRVERKLLAMLTDPRESPYGNPIPGLAELGGPADAGQFRTGVVPLTDALTDGGRRELLVRRLGEPLQTDLELMSRLSRLGVRPGLPVVAQRKGDDVRVTTALGEVDVPAPSAHHVFVDVLGERPPEIVGVS